MQLSETQPEGSNTPTGNRACKGCRAAKTRCNADPRQPAGPCLRCQRLKTVCDYSRLKPGRKPADRTSLGQARTPAAVREPERFMSIPAGVSENNERQSAQPYYSPLERDPAELNVARHLDPELPDDTSNVFTSPVAPLPRGLRTSQQDTTRAIGSDDPVRLGVLSLLEADNLIKNFYQFLNPILALFDHKLYTFDFIRSSSSILFTSVLTAAAKFFRKEVYPVLHSHAQTLLNRAMANGDCDLYIVQAVLILMHWKTPTDRSAWVKIGFAIRLSYQLGLHVVRLTRLPQDEMAARMIRAGERTWLCVSCFDRAYSEIFQLPPSIRLEEITDPEAWARERPDLTLTADLHVASAVATASPQMTWAKFRQTRDTLPKQWQHTFLQDIVAQYQRHMDHWFPLLPVFSGGEHMLLRWFDVHHLFRLHFDMIDCAPPAQAQDLIKECLRLAEEYATHTEAISQDGTLLYLQDTSATHLSSFGIIAYKLYFPVSPLERRLLDKVFRRLLDCCNRVAAGDDESITAFIARFFTRILHTIGVESKVASRAQTPRVPGTGDEENMLSLFDAQDDFSRIFQAPIPDAHEMDDQFWNSLFQSVPFYNRQ